MVEHYLAKVAVVGSTPITRSISYRLARRHLRPSLPAVPGTRMVPIAFPPALVPAGDVPVDRQLREYGIFIFVP